ncbi:hypothetical protein BASA81_008082 [Batrachochytrium salamandrivorans]|nr:hypothetical protein BASA81_008082 [Batrachochytrium salamandrivorans]
MKPQFEGFANKEFVSHAYSTLSSQDSSSAAAITTLPKRLNHTYNLLYQVGVGAYGSVYKAKCEQTGDIVALKRVKIDPSQNRHGFPIPAIREIKYLSQANHVNSVKLFEILSGGTGNLEDEDLLMTLVFEYVESDLCGYLTTCTLTEIHRLCIMKQLLDGLFYAHVNQICHRDLKPSNILINSKGNVRIGDWGMCRQVLPNRQYTNEVVTLWYRAPELVLGETRYGTEIDMWALGCVFAELYVGQAVLRGSNEDLQLKLILQLLGRPVAWPKAWDMLPRFPQIQSTSTTTVAQWDKVLVSVRSAAKELLGKLLCYDPVTRLTANQALDDELFWGADGQFACAPNMLPTPRGDGVHEFQLRAQQEKAESHKKRRLEV